MGPGPRLRECCRQGQAEVAPNLGNHLLADPCIKYSLARRRLDNIAEKWGRVSQKCYKFLYVIREWIISARKCVRPTTARTTTATSITIGGPTIIGTMIAKKVADCSITQRNLALLLKKISVRDPRENSIILNYEYVTQKCSHLGNSLENDLDLPLKKAEK